MYLLFEIAYRKAGKIIEQAEVTGYFFEYTDECLLIAEDSIESITHVTYPKEMHHMIKTQENLNASFNPEQVCIRTKSGIEHIVSQKYSRRTVPHLPKTNNN